LLSTRRLPAAARKGAGPHFATFSKMGIPEVHRVRAVWQACPEQSRRKQRRNRQKEPQKTYNKIMQNEPNLNI